MRTSGTRLKGVADLALRPKQQGGYITSHSRQHAVVHLGRYVNAARMQVGYAMSTHMHCACLDKQSLTQTVLANYSYIYARTRTHTCVQTHSLEDGVGMPWRRAAKMSKSSKVVESSGEGNFEKSKMTKVWVKLLCLSFK